MAVAVSEKLGKRSSSDAGVLPSAGEPQRPNERILCQWNPDSCSGASEADCSRMALGSQTGLHRQVG